MLIQIDVDSTLYDADKLFQQLFNDAGFRWKVRSPEWFGPEEVGCTLKEMKNLFRLAHSAEYVSQQKPYPHAVSVLQGIVDDYPEIELAYVSDRSEQQTKALRDWLEDQGFLNKDAHVATTADKRHWMRERKPEIVIDDRVRTMLMARYELGSYVVSLKQPHNVNLTGEAEHIYIVKDWKEIDQVLREVILPKLQEKSLSRTTEKRYVTL